MMRSAFDVYGTSEFCRIPIVRCLPCMRLVFEAGTPFEAIRSIVFELSNEP